MCEWQVRNLVCINECKYDKENKCCSSCLRTLDEIAYTGRLAMSRTCEEKLLTDEEDQ